MNHMTIAGAALLLLCSSSTRVEAQTRASTFDQLSVLVKAGDTIAVVDAAGRETKGRLAALSREALTLETAAGPRRLDEADVVEIRQRRGDSLQNGAIIGALAGAAYFITAATLLSDSDGGDIIVSTAIAGGALFVGMGAAAGAGIDAMITTRQVIYQRPAAGRVSIAPVVHRGGVGAAIAVRF